MTTPKLIYKAVDLAGEIEVVSRQHEVYKAGYQPMVRCAEELCLELEEILKDVSFDASAAKAAAFIATALEEEMDIHGLPYLGQALVLAAESQKGRTNEIGFQETVRYLLATNGYEPVRSKSFDKEVYHFFTDEQQSKVVAVSRTGCEVYTFELKSKYGLDELVDDFQNFKEGSSAKLKEYENRINGNTSSPAWGLGIMSLVSVAVIIPAWATDAISGALALGIVASEVAGTYGLHHLGQKVENYLMQKKIEEEQPNFPYTSLTKGVYALVDAFPLPENPILKEKPGLALLPDST